MITPDPGATKKNRKLVLIQIDGLSHTQFTNALKNGRMPFLSHLIGQCDYHKFSLYSGLPSSTPAVQGELFYGQKCAVPGFGFRHGPSGKLFNMVKTHAVLTIQKELEELDATELLSGGSAYSDIFSGGASRVSFCAGDLGLRQLFLRSPVKLLLMLLFHWKLMIRMLVLFIVETCLAFFDFFRSCIAREDLVKEFNFILSRISICILLREFITEGIISDINRGLPVIHANFIGYDEQSHRRGPSSRFAHWTLKGIDKCIKRIHAAAANSPEPYTVLVYSDHGHEKSLSYRRLNGKSIRKAVFDTFLQEGFLNGNLMYKNGNNNTLSVTAIGPIGHIYLSEIPELDIMRKASEILVRKASIPLVFGAIGDGGAIAWTADGEYRIPGDTVKVIGKDHPFPDEIETDLLALINHPHAGHLVIAGWNPENPLTFPSENGSHAGPGYEETHAFALLPPVMKYRSIKKYLRPKDLRNILLHFMNP